MKNILKSGMVVELRSGEKYLVVENYLIGYLGHMCLSGYNDDLTWKKDYQTKFTRQTRTYIDNVCSEYDIMKIWFQRDMSNLNSMLETDWLESFGNLIFNRYDNKEATVEMTVDEICKALGKTVKVVK